MFACRMCSFISASLCFYSIGLIDADDVSLRAWVPYLRFVLAVLYVVYTRISGFLELNMQRASYLYRQVILEQAIDAMVAFTFHFNELPSLFYLIIREHFSISMSDYPFALLERPGNRSTLLCI